MVDGRWKNSWQVKHLWSLVVIHCTYKKQLNNFRHRWISFWLKAIKQFYSLELMNFQKLQIIIPMLFVLYTMHFWVLIYD